jgi:hypothetical protein
MSTNHSPTVITHSLPLPSFCVEVKVGSQEESERPSPFWSLRGVSKLRTPIDAHLVVIPSLGGGRIIRVV